MLDALAAEALAEIVLTNTQGGDRLATQRPLQVEDRGDLWLVKGTPYDDEKLQLRFCQYYIFFRKTDAQIEGIGYAGRQSLDAEQAKYWRAVMKPDEFDRIFGPLKVFATSPVERDSERILYQAVYGGFINTASAATEYAYVLIKAARTPIARIRKENLKAEERDGVWHVTVEHAPGFASGGEILTLSRSTGGVLSGGL